MAAVASIHRLLISENPNPLKLHNTPNNSTLKLHHLPLKTKKHLRCLSSNSNSESPKDEEKLEESVGVKLALSILKFYKREISPVLPRSCRYIPTCSEYSMEAYKKYGVLKGTVLTTWRLCRCNPLGGSGFDPPRWFGESKIKFQEEEEDNYDDEVSR